jgi:transposase InsO family protein
METIVEKYNEYNYPSVGKLYTILKGKHKLKDIENALKGQNVFQLYKDQKKDLGRRIIALFPKENFQADLTFMEQFSKYNGGYKYILLVIDVFSRYVWGVPLKTKNVEEATEAFKSLPFKPRLLVSDNGSEFIGEEFQDMLDKKGIVHYTTVKGDHNALGIIDRMTRTLKQLLYKNFIANNNVKWEPILQKVIDTYNNTPHSGIYDYTPNEAFNDKNVERILFAINSQYKGTNSKVNEVKEGDFVRVRKPDWTFRRGYTPKWSEDVYEVEKRDGNTVYIDGKKQKIFNVQVVPHHVNAGSALKEATKEAKVKRVLRNEGVDTSNITTRSNVKRRVATKWDSSLIGRSVARTIERDPTLYKGTIIDYEKEGPYHWIVEYDVVPEPRKTKYEKMSKSELLKFLI